MIIYGGWRFVLLDGLLENIGVLHHRTQGSTHAHMLLMHRHGDGLFSQGRLALPPRVLNGSRWDEVIFWFLLCANWMWLNRGNQEETVHSYTWIDYKTSQWPWWRNRICLKRSISTVKVATSWLLTMLMCYCLITTYQLIIFVTVTACEMRLTHCY